MDENLVAFGRLLDIMDELREKCPWDKKQTFETLIQLTIEEVYELADAVLKKDADEIKNELGDLFLHLVFYAKLGSEQKAFSVAQVLNAVCDKLVRRHPHIYGTTKAETEEEVKQNWEKIKLSEKGSSNAPKSVLEGVPLGLPAIVKATRIQEKARGVGFDWDSSAAVWQKVEEELNELKEAVLSADANAIEDEFGDLMFALVNYARFIHVIPENALERTNQKFITRFQYIEKQANLNGKQITDFSLVEMEAYWQEAKTIKQN